MCNCLVAHTQIILERKQVTTSKTINDVSLVSLGTYMIKCTSLLNTFTTCITPKDIRRRFNFEIERKKEKRDR